MIRKCKTIGVEGNNETTLLMENESLTYRSDNQANCVKYLINYTMKKQLLFFVALIFATVQAWSNPITVGASGDHATLAAALSAAGTGDVISILDPGSYPGFTYSGTGDLTITNNSSGTVQISGASPALTVTSGTLNINGLTFVTSTNDPAILISGGKLVLRNSTVIESATFNQNGILITGGELDAGLIGDHGNNTFVVNGPGRALNNSGGVANAIGNYWGGTQYINVTSAINGAVSFDPWCNSTFTQCNYTAEGGPVTTAPGIVACDTVIDVPVTVDVFNNINAISLTLTYDANVLEYNPLITLPFTPHVALLGGSWNINSPAPGVLKIGWFSNTGVTINAPAPIQIISVKMQYSGGFTALTWDDSDPIFCEYYHALINGPYNDQPTASYYIDGWVTELAAALPGPDVTECQTIPTQTLTATATPVAPGSSIVWYDAQTGGNVVASPTLSAPGTVTYWAANASATCESVTRVPVTLHMDPKNVATIAYDNGNGQPHFCTNGSVANVIHTGTPGGIYSVQPSTGLVVDQNTGQVNIAASTAGTYTIVYTMQAVGLCPADAVTTQFVLTQLPTITTYKYDDSPFCFDAPNAMPNLVASNPNGVYSIPNPPFGLLFDNITGELFLQGQSPANTYNMVYTIPAAMGCPDVSKFTSVTVRPEFTLLTSSTNETCDGANDGTATVTPNNGVAPLTYLWSDPAAQTTQTATGLAHGTYSVTVTDANAPTACVQIATVTVELEPLPSPAIQPMVDISTVTKTPVIIHSEVTYPTFTIPAGYLADALISTTTPFPTGANVATVIYQEGANTVTFNPNFDLSGMSSVYLSDVLGTTPAPLGPHAGLTLNWTIIVDGFDVPATYPVTFQTVTYIDKSICVAPIGNAETFDLTFADMVDFSFNAAQAQIMCDEVTFTFTEHFPAILNMDTDVLSNAILSSNNPIPAGTTIDWSTSFGSGTYTVTTPLTSIYVNDLLGAPMANPIQNENGVNRTWTFTLAGPNLDQNDYTIQIDGIAQLYSADYIYETATIDLIGLPEVTTTAIDDIYTVTNTPVVIHQTVTYPSVITALPAVMNDGLFTSSVAFPTGAVLETITYDQGSGATAFNVNYPVGGITQLYLSDVFGSASPLNGHAGLTIDWTFTLSGMDVAQMYNITFTPVAYTDKTVCHKEIGATQDFDLTYADLVTTSLTPDPAQIICDEVMLTFNIEYPAIENIDNNTNVILNNAVLTSNNPLPASTIYWTYNGNLGTPYAVTAGATQILLSDITGMTAPLQGHGLLNDTWVFTISGANLAATDYTFTIENIAQLGGNDYVYNTESVDLNGLPVVTVSPIADISTVTKTPVIVPVTVSYPAVITAQNSVLTDALLSTSVALPTGTVIEAVTYDEGNGVSTLPVNFTGFDGIQTDFYLSDILGSAATMLNGHAGLTIDWTFLISGVDAPYNGIITVTPVAYQTKGFCESVIGNIETFELTFADLVQYVVTPNSPISGCDNEVNFNITIEYPAIVNVHSSITNDVLITSNNAFPVGTTIGWSYNGSPVNVYTLSVATTDVYLSDIVGMTPPAFVGDNLVTASWDFAVNVPNVAIATYELTIESMTKLGTTEYVYHEELVTLNTIPTPVVTDMTLQAQLGTDPAYLLAGTFPNFDMCIDPANVPTSYIVDIATLTANLDLEVGYYNPFYLPTTPSAALLTYWAGRGVTAASTGWQAQMWQIINGNEPMVYIYFDGTNYQLVDGLQYFLGGGTPPMTIPGDYPEDTYVLTGQVKEAFNGCLSAPFSVNLSLNTVPLLSVTGTDVTCFGANDGTIDVTVVGTHTPFNYNWTGPTAIGSIPNPTNLAPGLYEVTVTDTKGCVATIDYTINEPALLEVVAITSPTYNGGFNVSCNGLSDGAIDVTVQGGIGSYLYTWTGPVAIGNVGNITGVPAGLYSLVVTDANGCSATADITLTEPAPLTAAINSFQNISCFGFNDGEATVDVTGGYAAVDYQYSWAPSGQTTATAINLGPITHTVTVVDDNGCSTTVQVTLTEPAEVMPPTNPGNLTVCGTLPATQTIMATADVPVDHIIVWYDAAVGGSPVAMPTLNTIGSVTYYAEAMYLPTGCVSLSRTPVTLQIDQPASANIAYLDNPFCSIEDFAYVTRTGTPGGFPGGTPGGTYFAYQPGLTLDAATGTIDIQNSVPGTYQIGYVMPANGACPSALTTTTITIEQYPDATIAYNTPFCHNGATEQVTITGTVGGLFSYYSYPSLALNTVTGEITLGGASQPGTYTVYYSFAATAACPQFQTTAIVEVLDVVTATVTAVTDETCYGTNDGTITLDISGFVPPVSFTWAGPTTIGSSIQNPIGLAQGVYNVTVTDVHGCFATATATVNGVDQLAAAVAVTDVTCNGVADGIIEITNPTGGYGTYEFSIDGGASWQTAATFNNLPAGTYDVHMRDALFTSCFVDLDGTLNTVVNEPMPVTATVAYTEIFCNGAADGSITFSAATGGYGTYEYTIDGGVNWNANSVYTNLAPGAYDVAVRDAQFGLCITDLGMIHITEPAELTATVTKTDITCNGAGDGSIVVLSPAGGFGTYEFTKDGGTTWQAAPVFLGLNAGIYDVQMRDAAYPTCFVDLDGTLNTEITEPAPVSATVASVDVTCNGADDGLITITGATGGYGTYEYTIDGGATWSTSGAFTSLAPGTYDVQIRDAVYTYCIEVLDASLTITEPAAVTATVAVTNVSCNGANDGIIEITNVSGGYGTYEYTIDGGATWVTTSMFSGLAPGAYDVWVRDAQQTHCALDLDGGNTVITEPGTLLAMINAPVSFNGYNVSCNGAADGSVSTFVSGGTAPYQYNWTGPTPIGNVDNATGLSAGTYTLTVIDANGCSTTLSTTLTEPALLDVTGVSADVTCPGSSDGTIDLTVTGGVTPYDYTWTGPSVIGNTGNPTGLLAGNYDVVVSDANGCSTTFSITVGTTPDLTSPVFTCPADITQNNDAGDCGAIISIAIPVATDNCDPMPMVTGVRSDALALTDAFPVGVTTVVWTALDVNGNSSTCTQTITVIDTEAPMVTCPPDVNTLYTAGNCHAVVNPGVPTATDNCGIASVVGVRSDGLPLTDPYYSGLTTITWTITDLNNNTVTCTQNVNVTPTELLMLYNYNYATQYPISPAYIAPFMQGYATSFEPFLTSPTGTATGPLAFISDITTMGNNALSMAQSNGTNVRYFEFRVWGDSLYKYRDYQLYLQGRREAQAATQIALYYSFDGITFHPGDSMSMPVADTWFEHNFDLTGQDTINYTKNLYLRLYVRGSNISSGATRLDIDNFQLVAVNGPIARPDYATVQANGSVIIDVLANDEYGCNGPAAILPIFGMAVPANGTSTLNANGTFTYVPDANYVGADFFTYKICDDIGNCDTAIVYVNIVTPDLYLAPRVFLQGSFEAATGLMKDDLRVAGYVPTSEPYSTPAYSNGFTHVGNGGGETTTPAVLAVTGNDAIVDWVFIELRDKNDSTQVLATRAALVQRDGDVVDVDGVSSVKFSGLVGTEYFVAVRHRNHLGVMAANTINLNLVGAPIDFTNGSVAEFHFGIQNGIDYSTRAQKDLAPGVRGLHAGNANLDHKVKYQGTGNDRNSILTQVLNHPANTSNPPEQNFNFAVGYYSGDINMDGQIKYSGSGSDSNILLSIILNYWTGATYVFDFMIEQLP